MKAVDVVLETLLIAKAVHVVLETLAKVFFRVRERYVFREKVFAKVGYFESLSFSLYTLQLVHGYHLLPPGGPGFGRRMVPHIYLSLLR